MPRVFTQPHWGGSHYSLSFRLRTHPHGIGSISSSKTSPSQTASRLRRTPMVLRPLTLSCTEGDMYKGCYTAQSGRKTALPQLFSSPIIPAHTRTPILIRPRASSHTQGAMCKRFLRSPIGAEARPSSTTHPSRSPAHKRTPMVLRSLASVCYAAP